jgi:hypothetical protein
VTTRTQIGNHSQGYEIVSWSLVSLLAEPYKAKYASPIPEYIQPLPYSPNAPSELDSKSRAWTVVILDLSSASPRRDLTRRRNPSPAVAGDVGSSL